MAHERWFRGQHDGQGRPFDWLTPARQHGIPEDLARSLYERALQQARGAGSSRVQESYLALLAEARPDASRPSPGKVTRIMRLQADRAGKRRRPSHGSRLTGQPIAPCKTPLTSYVDPLHGPMRGPARGPAHERHDERAMSEELARLVRARAFSEPEDARADAAIHRFEASLAVALGDVDALDARDRELLAAEYGVELGVAWPDAVNEDSAMPPLPGVTPAHLEHAVGQREGAPARPVERLAARLEVPQDASSDWVQAMQRDRGKAPGDVTLPAGTGQPLPPALRARMEAAFEHDFAHVRIHTDSASGDAARQMKAHAVTEGSHVYFGHGEFEPGTPEGDRLLLHELTHVVQADQGRLPSRGGLSAPHDPHEREAYAAETRMASALSQVDADEVAPPTLAPSRISGPVSARLVSRDAEEAAPGAPPKTGPTTSEDALLGDLPTVADAAPAPAPAVPAAEAGPEPAAPSVPQPGTEAAPVAANAAAPASAPASEPVSAPISAPGMREAPAGSPPAAPAVAPPPALASAAEWAARAREEGARQSARIVEATSNAAAQVRATAASEAARATAAFAGARARLEADAATTRAEIQTRAEATRAAVEASLTALSAQLDVDFAAREETARGAVEAARTQVSEGVEAEAQRAVTESEIRAQRALALADIEGGGGDEPLAAGQRDIARRVANEVAAQCRQTGADAAAEVRKAGASQLSGVDAQLDGVLATLAQARESARAKLDSMRSGSLSGLDEKAAEACAEIDVRVAEASATLATRASELTGWLTSQAETEAAAIEARAVELTGSIDESFAALASAYDQCQAEIDAALADAPDATPESIAEVDAGVVRELERMWQESAAPQIAQAEQAAAALTSHGAGVSEGFASAVAEAETSSGEAAEEQRAQIVSVGARFSDACASIDAQVGTAAQQGLAGELAEADRAVETQQADLDAAVAEALGGLTAAVDAQLAWEDEQIANASQRISSGQAQAASDYESAKAEARARDEGEQATSRGWLGDLWNFFDDLAQRTLEWFQEKLGRVWGNIIGGILAGIIYVVGVVVCGVAWLGAQVINLVWGFLWGETAIPGYGGGVFAFIADVIAGVLVYGDIRDIFKYWIWRPLWGEGPWWLNLLMGAVALLGIIPVVGDGLKALIKALKAGSKTALKWLAKLVGEELAERIARALGEEAAERIGRRLAEELGDEVAGKLIRELGAEAAEELLERLGADALGKLAQDLSGATIQRLADEIGERALKKLAEELSGAAIEKIAGDLGQEAIEKLLRTVGGNAIEELNTQLGKDALLKLLDGLRGVTIKEYFDALGGPALKNLARDLDGYAVKELMDALGAPTLKALADDLGGAAIKQLLDDLGEETLKRLVAKLDVAVISKLVADLTAPELKRLFTELGDDVFAKLAKEFDGPAIKQLVDELTAQGVKDLGPDALVKIGKHLTPTQIAEFVRELGAHATKKLAKRYGGRAMAHYGMAFFKSWKGVTDYTIHHLVRGHGINNKKISGCHDLARFISQYGSPTATIEKVFIHSQRRSGQYVEYIYSLFKKDGSGLPAAAQPRKTVVDGLEASLPAWKKQIVDAIDDTIENLTFPTTGPGFSISIDGVTWEGFFRNGRIDSIFPTL